MSTSPYRKLASVEKKKNPSIGSDTSGSVLASSRYSTNVSRNVSEDARMDPDVIYDLDDDSEIPQGSIVKRPSMYVSDANAARPSRRQNLLKRRSQILQQVDEVGDASATSPQPPLTPSQPKFVVTNPDLPPSQSLSPALSVGTLQDDDLKQFVNLMRSKGNKLSPSEIAHLRSLGKVPSIANVNRASALSQYSGVVEEVEEVQRILPDKASYVPSLVEVSSTVHKRGSSSNDSNSRDDKSERKKTKDNDHVQEYQQGYQHNYQRSYDYEASIRSADTSLPLGPLPTTARNSHQERVRSPDLSQMTAIDPTIPPRSEKRPRSLIILSPDASPSRGLDAPLVISAAGDEVVRPVTPLRAGNTENRDNSAKRASLPPPNSDLPLTPAQQKEKRLSGVYSGPNIDYATLLKKKPNSDLKDRRRISSLNRPLPEIPKHEEDEEDEEEEQDQGREVHIKQEAPAEAPVEALANLQGNISVQSLMQELKNDSSKTNLESSQSPESFRSPEKFQSPMEIKQEPVTAFRVKSVQSSIVENETPIKMEEPVQPSSSNHSSDSPERRIQFDESSRTASPPKKKDNSKFAGKNFSVSTFNTDNASFHTADDIGEYGAQVQDVIRTTDMSAFENDDNYEDIEVVEKKPNKKHTHKKKSSSSSSAKKLRPFSISTLSKLLESTDGVIIGEEFDHLDISNDEKKYIEKIVDVIARLTADMVADPSRHDGTINRMKLALRILEGFE